MFLFVFNRGWITTWQRLKHRWERLPKHIDLSGGLRKWFPVQLVTRTGVFFVTEGRRILGVGLILMNIWIPGDRSLESRWAHSQQPECERFCSTWRQIQIPKNTKFSIVDSWKKLHQSKSILAEVGINDPFFGVRPHLSCPPPLALQGSIRELSLRRECPGGKYILTKLYFKH